MTPVQPERTPLAAALAAVSLLFTIGCGLGVLLWVGWPIWMIAFLAVWLPLGIAQMLGRPIDLAWARGGLARYHTWHRRMLAPYPKITLWAAPLGLCLTLLHLFIQTYAEFA